MLEIYRRKEERSKQGQTNKQGKAAQHTQGSHFSKEKSDISGGTGTQDTLHSRQSTLYHVLSNHIILDLHELHVHSRNMLSEVLISVCILLDYHTED